MQSNHVAILLAIKFTNKLNLFFLVLVVKSIRIETIFPIYKFWISSKSWYLFYTSIVHACLYRNRNGGYAIWLHPISLLVLLFTQPLSPPSRPCISGSSLDPCDVFGKIIKQNCIWATDLLPGWTFQDDDDTFQSHEFNPKTPHHNFVSGQSWKMNEQHLLRAGVVSLGGSCSVCVII